MCYKHVVLVLVESKINRTRVDEQARKLDFSGHFCVKTNNLCGRVWLFWHMDVV